jgi:hypothetical protein
LSDETEWNQETPAIHRRVQSAGRAGRIAGRATRQRVGGAVSSPAIGTSCTSPGKSRDSVRLSASRSKPCHSMPRSFNQQARVAISRLLPTFPLACIGKSRRCFTFFISVYCSGFSASVCPHPQERSAALMAPVPAPWMAAWVYSVGKTDARCWSWRSRPAP